MSRCHFIYFVQLFRFSIDVEFNLTFPLFIAAPIHFTTCTLSSLAIQLFRARNACRRFCFQTSATDGAGDNVEGNESNIWSDFFGNFLPILGGTVESFCAASDRSNSNSGKSRDCAHLRNQLDPIPDEFDRLSVTTIQTFHSLKK